MRSSLLCLGCVAALAASFMCGCQSSTGSKSYAKDPLLVSNKPSEGGTPRPGPPPLLASAQPVPPPAPTTALVSGSMPAPQDAFAQDRPGISARPVSTTKGPVTATPAVRSLDPSNPGSLYAQAADHSWLQGVLDKHYHGHFDLRYCDATVEDRLGGKVTLDDDPRLAQFQDGDVVYVEGTLVAATERSERGSFGHYPRYHLREIRLIQRRNP